METADQPPRKVRNKRPSSCQKWNRSSTAMRPPRLGAIPFLAVGPPIRADLFMRLGKVGEKPDKAYSVRSAAGIKT